MDIKSIGLFNFRNVFETKPNSYDDKWIEIFCPTEVAGFRCGESSSELIEDYFCQSFSEQGRKSPAESSEKSSKIQEISELVSKIDVLPKLRDIRYLQKTGSKKIKKKHDVTGITKSKSRIVIKT